MAIKSSYVKDEMTMDDVCVFSSFLYVWKVSVAASLDSSQPSGDIDTPAG